MKYLCLVYFEESKLHNVPESPQDEECVSYDQGLREQGIVLASEALEPVESATTVRVRDGRVSVTDSPFAETKEQLGGFHLIEAKNLDEAIQVAKGIPSARIGSIEIRPIRQLPDPS